MLREFREFLLPPILVFKKQSQKKIIRVNQLIYIYNHE